MKKNDSALFFLCSLIEFIGRQQKRRHGEVVDALGDEILRRIYTYADTLHCEPMDQVADRFISLCGINEGEYDNISECQYEVPDYWTMGEVYERLIEDVSGEDVVGTLKDVYGSWIDEKLSNYNTDFYYQSRDYLRECYLAGETL